MTDRDPIEVTNLDRYGSPPLLWSRAALAKLSARDAAIVRALRWPVVVCFFGLMLLHSQILPQQRLVRPLARRVCKHARVMMAMAGNQVCVMRSPNGGNIGVRQCEHHNQRRCMHVELPNP